MAPGDNYRKKFWSNPELLRAAAKDVDYKGFFTYQNVRCWSKEIKNRDMVFRIGYTLGFSKQTIETLTGLYNMNYDRKRDSVISNAFHEFVLYYLCFNKDVTDFRFYRSLREIIRLSIIPQRNKMKPHIPEVVREQKETFHEQIVNRTIGWELRDDFMIWKSENFKSELLDGFSDIFYEIINDDTLKKKYEDVLCISEITGYLQEKELRDKIDANLEGWKKWRVQFYRNKLLKEEEEARKKEEEARKKEEETREKALVLYNGEKSYQESEQIDLANLPPLPKPKDLPERPKQIINERRPLVGCISLKAVKLYSTIQGYLVDNPDDEIIRKYNTRLEELFTPEFKSCYFLVDRQIKPDMYCQNERNLIPYKPLIQLITEIDSQRTYKGDILCYLRDENLELNKKYPDCPWLRTFLRIYNWRSEWDEEKFDVIFRRFLLRRNMRKLSEEYFKGNTNSIREPFTKEFKPCKLIEIKRQSLDSVLNQ
ncbi:hypothetical protein Ahia01_000603900 [Argonauta hians]